MDDYFTPEINSSANPAAPTDPNQPDWTTGNLLTQQSFSTGLHLNFQSC